MECAAEKPRWLPAPARRPRPRSPAPAGKCAACLPGYLRRTVTVTGTDTFGWLDAFVSKLITPCTDCFGICVNLATTTYDLPASFVTNSRFRSFRLVVRFLRSEEHT